MHVFSKCDISRVMDLILDPPMAAIEVEQSFGIGLLASQIGDAIGDFGCRFQFARHAITKLAFAGNAKHLLHAGPTELCQHLVESRCGLDGSLFATSMSFVIRCMLLAFSSPLLGLVGGKRPRRRRQIHWKLWPQASADCLLR